MFATYNGNESIRITGEDHPFPEDRFILGKVYHATKAYKNNDGIIVKLEEGFPAFVSPHLYDDVELLNLKQ